MEQMKEIKDKGKEKRQEKDKKKGIRNRGKE